VRVKNFSRGLVLCALALCALQLFSPFAYGTLITYSDVSGANVTYSSITEEPTRSTSPGPIGALPNFGQPAGGDSLSFPALSFLTNASGGSSDTADSKLSMIISSKNNSTGISEISLSELGDYKLVRNTTASDPLVEVSAIGWIKVLEINGSAITPFYVPNASGDQFDKEYHLSGSQLKSSPLLTQWSGSLDFKVAQALRNHGYDTGYATKVSFVLDNSLLSITDANAVNAYIAKKDVILTTTTVDAPEPSVLVMLAAAALGFVVWKRKK
jgi:hypothetical protein